MYLNDKRVSTIKKNIIVNIVIIDAGDFKILK